MLAMIAAVLLAALPGEPTPDLRTGEVHPVFETPRLHAAPDTVLDHRMAAVLRMLADSAGFPESPILFTKSAGALDRLGSVLERESALAVLDRVSVRLGHRSEERVLDWEAECDVVIVPGREGRVSGQFCRDAEGTLARALELVVTRHDEEVTTIQVWSWSVARTPTIHPVHGSIYIVDAEQRGAELELKVRSREIASYRYPDGTH